MPKKTFTPEQIVPKLRQIEVLIGQGKAVPLACKEAGITAQTFYRERPLGSEAVHLRADVFYPEGHRVRYALMLGWWDRLIIRR